MKRRLAFGWSAAITIVLLAAAAPSCLDPTETTLVLTTDVQCDARKPRTAVYVNAPGDVDMSSPRTVTPQCDASGNIGTLVVVPETKDERFQVDVITALDGQDPATCGAHPERCIFSRRRITSIPHTPLTLPIENLLVCLGVVCDPASTCYKGVCVPNEVDAHKCAAIGGCELDADGGVALDASMPRDGAPPPPQDGAMPPEDGAMPPQDGAMPPMDAGVDAPPPPIDSGIDAGLPTDSGMGFDALPPIDAAGPPDSGLPDSGLPPIDAGFDSGGPPPIDAGMDAALGGPCMGFTGFVSCPPATGGGSCDTSFEGCCAAPGGPPSGVCDTSPQQCSGYFLCCTGKAECGGIDFCCQNSFNATMCVSDPLLCDNVILCQSQGDCPANTVCAQPSPNDPRLVCMPIGPGDAGGPEAGLPDAGGATCMDAGFGPYLVPDGGCVAPF